MKPLVALLVVFAVGCAGNGKAPELTQYLLRTDTSKAVAGQPPAGTGIGDLTVASYIDDPGLVLESGSGEVRTARYHQWAEPLRESLRSYLANEIAAASGRLIGHHKHGASNWKRRVDIHIDQLHGTADGDAILVASWVVVDTASSTLLSETGFFETEPLSGDGYEALVLAEKRLLSRLAAAVAATLDPGNGSPRRTPLHRGDLHRSGEIPSDSATRGQTYEKPSFSQCELNSYSHRSYSAGTDDVPSAPAQSAGNGTLCGTRLVNLQHQRLRIVSALQRHADGTSAVPGMESADFPAC